MSDSVKFLHTADLHLDSPLSSLASRNPALARHMLDASRTVLCRLVDLAIDEAVDAVLIAGDLFDGDQRDIHTAMVLQRELRRLEKADIPVFIIWGNHDAEAALFTVIEWPDNVHTFDGRGGRFYFAGDRAVVHGTSFRNRQAPESLLGRFGKADAHCFNIGMLHTSLTGADGHNNYAPCTVSELIDKGYDYWALGHIHKRSVHCEQPAIVMPGNPLGRHINEDGERTVSLVTLSSDAAPHIQAISLAPIRFDRVHVNLDDMDDKREATELMTSAIHRHRDTHDTDQLIVRLELTGSTRLASSFQRDSDLLLEQLQFEFDSRADIWIDSVNAHALSLPGREINAGGADSSLVTELSSLVGDELLGTINLLEEVAADVQLLKRALPRELADLFGKTPEQENEYIRQTLLPEAATWMIRQLERSDEEQDQRSEGDERSPSA